MNQLSEIDWLHYLNHNDKENLCKFLIDENRKVRFSKEEGSNKVRCKYFQFENGAKSKWHYHTKKHYLIWIKGSGFVEIAYNRDVKKHKQAEQDKNTDLGKVIELSQDNKRVKIPPFSIYRHGILDDDKEFVHLDISRGETVWIEDSRYYTATTEDTFNTSAHPHQNENQLKIYSEVNNNYRHLADIRFKLLALVPAVSIVSWIALLKTLESQNFLHNLVGIIIGFLALRIIHGIVIYNDRNDDIYNDLISRGRKIEDEMQVSTGIFKGRKKGILIDSTFVKIRFRINHETGLNLIYRSVRCGWYLVILLFIYQLTRTGIATLVNW